MGEMWHCGMDQVAVRDKYDVTSKGGKNQVLNNTEGWNLCRLLWQDNVNSITWVEGSLQGFLPLFVLILFLVFSQGLAMWSRVA